MANNGSTSNGGTVATAEGVEEIRDEVVEFFAEIGRTLRLPPSIGRIYGLLFAASEPLPFDEIGRRLQLSKGAVSQGLQVLQELQAVRLAKVEGDRRSFYQPETSLRRLTRHFLSEVIGPRLEAGQQRIDELEQRLDAIGAKGDDDNRAAESASVAELRDRVQSLRVWQGKLRRLLPWVSRLTLPGLGRGSGKDRDRGD